MRPSFPRAVCVVALLLALSCGKAKPPPPTPWSPGTSFDTPSTAVYRNLLDRRGLIHAHNVHSHDACDNAPVNPTTGAPNQACYQDFRGDLCKASLDFVFLTDHGGFFDTTEYPDAMHYDPSFGDTLVSRNGGPVANLTHCADGHTLLLIPGNEGNNLMPVGLETQVGDVNTRTAVYGTSTAPSGFPGNQAAVAQAIATDQAHGAVVLVAHPEGLTPAELAAFPIDGFEMYNLHANALFTNYGLNAVLTLVTNVTNGNTQGVPTNPNSIFLGIFNEDPRYLNGWATVLSQGQHRVTTLGSDCHQNAIPTILSDGERGDRYRRVMQWFSNHLMVHPNGDGSWDDSNLKEALKAGRLYGVFEALGYPVGFDFHASTAGTISEMGDTAALSGAPTLSVTLPTIQSLDPSAPAPTFTVRILRADATQWTEVASGAGDLTYAPTQSGAYRAEIRMIPSHLTDALGPVAHSWLAHDYVWIYANPIYVK